MKLKALLLTLLALPIFAQDVFTTGTPIAGSAVTTSDMLQIRDVSVTSGAGKVRPMTLGELVNVPSLFSSVPDGTFTIAKTTGLQTALNGKEPALGNPSTNGYVLSSTTGGARSWVAQSGGGGGTWGGITGTLSAQTDLDTALGDKLSLDGSNPMTGTLIAPAYEGASGPAYLTQGAKFGTSASITDTGNFVSLSPTGRTLNDTAGAIVYNWSSGTLVGDGTGLTGIDKAFVGLGNVENTALSTWAGSTNITTLGTASANSLDSAGLVEASGYVGPSTGMAYFPQGINVARGNEETPRPQIGFSYGGFTANLRTPADLSASPIWDLPATAGTLALASQITGTNSGTNTGDQTITLTGDVTGGGTGSFAATLANTAVTPGSYTSTNITVDAKGRITAAANGSGGGGGTWGSITGTLSGQTEFSQASRTVSGYTAPVFASALDTLKLTGHQKISDNQTHKLHRIVNRMAIKNATGAMKKSSLFSVCFGDSVAFDAAPILARHMGYGGQHAGALFAGGTANGSNQGGTFATSPNGGIRRVTAGQTLTFNSQAGFDRIPYATIGVGFIASNTTVGGVTRGKFMLRYRDNYTGNYTENAAPFLGGRVIASSISYSTANSFLGMSEYSAIRDGMFVTNPANSHIPANTIVRYNPSPVRILVSNGVATGFTPGTYTAVALSGGTGTGATATIVIDGTGALSTVTIVNNGEGYTEGDDLAATIPGNTGFTVEVRGVHAKMVNATTGTAVTPTNTSSGPLRFQFPNSGSDDGNQNLNVIASGASPLTFVDGSTVAERIYNTYTPDSSDSNYTQVWVPLAYGAGSANKRWQVELVCVEGSIEIVDYFCDAGALAQGNGFQWSGGGASFAAGGTWLDNGGNGHVNITDNNMNRVLWYYDPEVITYKTANGYPGPNGLFTSAWTTFTNKIKAAAPNATLFVYGSHPTGAFPTREDAGQRLGDDFLKKWCAESENAVFIDMRSAYPEPEWRLHDPESFVAGSADLLHQSAVGAAPWTNALTKDVLAPAFDAIGQFMPTTNVYGNIAAPGTFNEIRLADVSAASDSQPVKPFIFTFPEYEEASIQMKTPANTLTWAGMGKGAANQTSPNLSNHLFFFSGGTKVQAFSGSGMLYHYGQVAQTDQAQNGIRFNGHTGAGTENFTIGTDASRSSVSAMKMFGLNRHSTTLAPGVDAWRWMMDGAELKRPVITKTLTVTANASTSVTMPDTTGVVAGMQVYGGAIATGTTVSSVTNGTTIVLSIAATGTNTTLHFSRPNDLRFIYDVPSVTTNPGQDVTINTPISAVAGDHRFMVTGVGIPVGINGSVKYAGQLNSKGFWTTGGQPLAGLTGTAITWTGSAWHIKLYTNGTPNNTDFHSSTSAVDYPDAATGWTLNGSASGTAVVVRNGRSLAVIPSFINTTTAEAVVNTNEAYYDEATGKAKVDTGSTKIDATLAAAATTLAVTNNFVKVTGDAGANTLATITGGFSGQRLTLLFVDALVTITDTDATTADTVDLSAAFTSSARDTITLINDGNKWIETARSAN